MYVGHFATALALKARVPRAPTWALLVGTSVLDLLFPVFLLTGAEKVAHGRLEFIDWSHSLVTSFGWSLAFALLFWRRGRDVALALFIAAWSHFWLDLLVHEPDLALFPHSPTHLGLGPMVAGWQPLIELAVTIAGCAYYFFRAKASTTHGRNASDSVLFLLGLAGLRQLLGLG